MVLSSRIIIPVRIKIYCQQYPQKFVFAIVENMCIIKCERRLYGEILKC